MNQKSTMLVAAFCLFAFGESFALPKVQSAVKPPSFVETDAMAALASSPVTKLLPQTIGHPRITGEYLPELAFKDTLGQDHTLSTLTRGKFTVLVFSKPDNIRVEASSGYFRKIAPYLRDLGYQIILVSPESNEMIREISQRLRESGQKNGILIDENRSSLIKMGLTTDSQKDAPMINAIYLVSPEDQILFHYASVSDKIPFSGEVLVLAARVYKEAIEKAPK